MTNYPDEYANTSKPRTQTARALLKTDSLEQFKITLRFTNCRQEEGDLNNCGQLP
jgi:hypothetical protein